MMVLEVSPQHAENTLILDMIQNPEFFAAILGGTLVGPVVGVRIALLHGDHGIEVEIPYP